MTAKKRKLLDTNRYTRSSIAPLLQKSNFDFFISKGLRAASGERGTYQREKTPLLPLCHFFGTLPVPKSAIWLAGSYYASQTRPRAGEGQDHDSPTPGAHSRKQWQGGRAGSWLQLSSYSTLRANPSSSPSTSFLVGENELSQMADSTVPTRAILSSTV